MATVIAGPASRVDIVNEDSTFAEQPQVAVSPKQSVENTALPSRDVQLALEQLYALDNALQGLRNTAPDPTAITANAGFLYQIAASPLEYPEAAPLAQELLQQLSQVQDAGEVSWSTIMITRGGINGTASPADQIQQAVDRGLLTGAHLTPDSLPAQLFQASVSIEKLGQLLGIQPQDYAQYQELRESPTTSPQDLSGFYNRLRELPDTETLLKGFPPQ